MEFDIHYSEFYNAIHSEKEYTEDALNLKKKIRQYSRSANKILDFGCGTGKHLAALNNLGFITTGYDPSPNMIQIAKLNYPDLKFTSDLHEIREVFDVCVCLFDVFSYMNLDEFGFSCSQINKMLTPNGLLLGELWSLPGVLNSPPENRVKFFKYHGEIFRREVEIHTIDSPLYVLLIRIFGPNNSLLYEEKHSLRAYTNSEIIENLTALEFELLSFENWSDSFSTPETFLPWRIHFVARKKI
jgi:SAM-dependent methyltransferase